MNGAPTAALLSEVIATLLGFLALLQLCHVCGGCATLCCDFSEGK